VAASKLSETTNTSSRPVTSNTRVTTRRGRTKTSLPSNE
jgi:hypothetical protein